MSDEWGRPPYPQQGPYPPQQPPYPPYPQFQPPPRRGVVLPVVLAVCAAALLLVVAVAVPLVMLALRSGDPAAGPSDLSAVQEYTSVSDHTAFDVTYDQTPPVGGEHAPVWLECGVYDEPVTDELAVHSLEHGAVWITYEPGLDAAGIAKLADTLPDNGVLSPYPDLPAPVVVTVWDRQLLLNGPDDPRLGMFIAEFGDGHTSPEPGVTCHGGVPDLPAPPPPAPADGTGQDAGEVV